MSKLSDTEIKILWKLSEINCLIYWLNKVWLKFLQIANLFQRTQVPVEQRKEKAVQFYSLLWHTGREDVRVLLHTKLLHVMGQGQVQVSEENQKPLQAQSAEHNRRYKKGLRKSRKAKAEKAEPEPHTKPHREEIKREPSRQNENSERPAIQALGGWTSKDKYKDFFMAKVRTVLTLTYFRRLFIPHSNLNPIDSSS